MVARGILLLLLVTSLSSEAMAQATPTMGALTHTFMFQYHNERGAIFSIDVDGREYWVTAKHIFTGAQHAPYGQMPKSAVDVEIVAANGQPIIARLAVVNPVSDENADVAVLASPETPLGTPGIKTDSNVLIGGDCQFLGYPFGTSWMAKLNGQQTVLPFAKHCVISAIFQEPVGQIVLDGINNAGFSGGPVLYGTGPNQSIFAIISGYLPEEVPVSVAPGAPAVKESVSVNSGFILAFSIDLAIDAARKNPIGPLRSVAK